MRKPLSQYVLLVVDDNENNLTILKRRLSQCGFSVMTATNGQDALNIVSQVSCDLLLLDIMMPVMDGFEVLKTIRKTQSMMQLPIIMITALQDSKDVVEALEHGANDYITKPIDLKSLQARVNTHLTMKELAKENEEFLSIASHDIKKPVMLIRDVVQVIQDEYGDLLSSTEDLNEMMGMIRRASDSLQSLIEDYLEGKVIDHGRLELDCTELDLNDVIRDIVSVNMGIAANKGIVLQMELQDAMPVVQADRSRINQVVDNLIGNAIKFSKADTIVKVTTSDNDGGILLEVKDQGPGIKDEERSKVFNRFASLSNKPTGGETSTGLGLSLCKQLVELHGGKIGVSPNEPVGSNFWFQLPVNQNDGFLGVCRT